MKHFTLLIIFLLSTLTSSIAIDAKTPTEKFIEKHQNQENFKEFLSETNKYHPLFKKLIENEQDPIFFGYHGSSMAFRVYQDIIRVVFEEVLQIPIPEDFHFFRIPSDPEFLTTNFASIRSKLEFNISIEEKKEWIEKLLIKTDELTEDQITQLWAFLEDISQTFLPFSESIKPDPYIKRLNSTLKLPEEKIKTIVQQLLVKKHLIHLATSTNNSEIRKIFLLQFGWKYLSKHPLSYKGCTDEQKADFMSNTADMISIWTNPKDFDATSLYEKESEFIAFLESNLGFSNTEAKVYVYNLSQAIYPLTSIAQFTRKFGVCPFYNRKNSDHDLQKYITSVNIALYNNFDNRGEFSLYPFLCNSSIAGGSAEEILKSSLRIFFTDVGLPKSLVSRLFNKGLKKLNKVQNEGVIFQLFSNSMESISNMSYASTEYGYSCLNNKTPYYIEDGERQFDYLPQLRLIMNAQMTLNPFGDLKIKRYDTLPKRTVQRYMKKLRVKVRNSKKNSRKVKEYKEKMLNLWQNDPS